MLVKVEKDNGKQTDDLEAFKSQADEQFLIPGLIGPDKKGDAYKSIQDFVKEMHMFKEESAAQNITLMNSKIVAEKKRSEQLLSDMKASLMELHEK